MPVYVISYDSPTSDYQDFYDAMSEEDAAHALESVWLISSVCSAATLRDWTYSKLGSGTKVAVIELDSAGDWATKGVKKEAVDFLKKHLGA